MAQPNTFSSQNAVFLEETAMKTKAFLVSCMSVVAAGGLVACGTNAPAFMEMSLSDTEYAANSVESDRSANTAGVATLAKSVLPTATLDGVNVVREQTINESSVNNVNNEESSFVAGSAEGADGSGSQSGIGGAQNPLQEESTSTTGTLPSRADAALSTCLNAWPTEVASFAKTYSVVSTENKNNRIVFSDKSIGETVHSIDLSTKNTNLGILELKNPLAAYCIHHNGWNANNITIRIACSARLIELDANLKISHDFTIERVGCE
jgi:hypothetical protein